MWLQPRGLPNSLWEKLRPRKITSLARSRGGRRGKQEGTRLTVSLFCPSQQPSDEKMEAQGGDPEGTWLQDAELGLGPGLVASSLGLSSPLLGEMRKFQRPLFCLPCGLQRHLEGQRPKLLSQGHAPSMPHPATHLHTPTSRLSLHGGALSFRGTHFRPIQTWI